MDEFHPTTFMDIRRCTGFAIVQRLIHGCPGSVVTAGRPTLVAKICLKDPMRVLQLWSVAVVGKLGFAEHNPAKRAPLVITVLSVQNINHSARPDAPAARAAPRAQVRPSPTAPQRQ